MTFQAYQRARRLGLALGRIRQGEDLTRTAYEHGYESPSGFRDAFAQLFGDTPGKGRGTAVVTVTRLASALGPMIAGVTEEGVCLLEFADRPMVETQVRRIRRAFGAAIAPGEHPMLDRLQEELNAYFTGELRTFTVPLVLGGTPFQQRAWTYLRNIPYGETRSYDDEARAIGQPQARRAVGRANGDNRISIIIPCHRVIRSDGSLSGYGGQLWRKRALLELEQGRALDPRPPGARAGDARCGA